MKRLMTLFSLIFILMAFTALSARGHQNGQGQAQNHGNYSNHNQDNQCDEIREFRGFLVDSDRGNWDKNINVHFNISPNVTANVHMHQDNDRNNGYGIVTRKPNGDRVFLNLDRKGDRIARQMLSHRWKAHKKVLVEVKGTLNMRTKTIEVVSLRRIKANNHFGWG